MDILTNGTLSSIQNMTWNGQLGFSAAPSKYINITLPDLVYGSLFLDQYGASYDEPQGIMGVVSVLPKIGLGAEWKQKVLEMFLMPWTHALVPSSRPNQSLTSYSSPD
jgi:hypothetical protein